MRKKVVFNIDTGMLAVKISTISCLGSSTIGIAAHYVLRIPKVTLQFLSLNISIPVSI